MSRSVFEFKSYKEFLNEYIDSSPSNGHGMKKILAEASGCQPAYVSRVLTGDAHFSMEQADAVARHIGLNPAEAEFFWLLLQFERAGTRELRAFIQSKMDDVIEKRSRIKDRIAIKESLSQEAHSIYYSVWYYAAIHVLLALPELRTREALARHLDLPARRVSEVLDFLVQHGLATHKAGKYVLSTRTIHLDKSSPMISKHHANWRLQALRSLEREGGGDLHYSAMFTLSDEDLAKVKALVMRLLEDTVKIVKETEPARGHVLSIDFFELAKG